MRFFMFAAFALVGAVGAQEPRAARSVHLHYPAPAAELAIAAESNKRFVPILYREPGKSAALHAKISSHNWVFMRDEQEVEKNLPPLVQALNTDLDWLAQHTRLLNRALEWQGKARNDSYLVRGTDLQDAQSFIEKLKLNV